MSVHRWTGSLPTRLSIQNLCKNTTFYSDLYFLAERLSSKATSNVGLSSTKIKTVFKLATICRLWIFLISSNLRIEHGCINTVSYSLCVSLCIYTVYVTVLNKVLAHARQMVIAKIKAEEWKLVVFMFLCVPHVQLIESQSDYSWKKTRKKKHLAKKWVKKIEAVKTSY